MLFLFFSLLVLSSFIADVQITIDNISAKWTAVYYKQVVYIFVARKFSSTLLNAMPKNQLSWWSWSGCIVSSSKQWFNIMFYYYFPVLYRKILLSLNQKLDALAASQGTKSNQDWTFSFFFTFSEWFTLCQYKNFHSLVSFLLFYWFKQLHCFQVFFFILG
jgi:hypothetical protein